jgi:hypothetical protein
MGNLLRQALEFSTAGLTRLLDRLQTLHQADNRAVQEVFQFADHLFPARVSLLDRSVAARLLVRLTKGRPDIDRLLLREFYRHYPRQLEPPLYDTAGANSTLPRSRARWALDALAEIDDQGATRMARFLVDILGAIGKPRGTENESAYDQLAAMAETLDPACNVRHNAVEQIDMAASSSLLIHIHEADAPQNGPGYYTIDLYIWRDGQQSSEYIDGNMLLTLDGVEQELQEWIDKVELRAASERVPAIEFLVPASLLLTAFDEWPLKPLDESLVEPFDDPSADRSSKGLPIGRKYPVVVLLGSRLRTPAGQADVRRKMAHVARRQPLGHDRVLPVDAARAADEYWDEFQTDLSGETPYLLVILNAPPTPRQIHRLANALILTGIPYAFLPRNGCCLQLPDAFHPLVEHPHCEEIPIEVRNRRKLKIEKPGHLRNMTLIWESPEHWPARPPHSSRQVGGARLRTPS